MKWFNLDWWGYLFSPKSDGVSWWAAFNCRRKNHPCGVVYVNAMGVEPDMTCKNCRDDLG